MPTGTSIRVFGVDMEKYIDASGQIAGRLASNVAKGLLKGDVVVITNAEKAVITGDKVYTEGMFKERMARGDAYHGPFFPREPDKLLRRMIRCMLPFHTARGREAFRNLKVYKSVPEALKSKKYEKPYAESKAGSKQMTIGQISLKLGSKKTW